MIFNHDVGFWLTAIGAAILRMFLTPWVGWIKSTISFITAIFFALVFTDSVVDYLHLNPDTYKVGVTAIVALTGESIARWALAILENPKIALDWFKAWRGGGKREDKN